jgi:hypothetical protein
MAAQLATRIISDFMLPPKILTVLRGQNSIAEAAASPARVGASAMLALFLVGRS